ncbi:MAG: ABC transporter permease [bacterium]|nr:ABC transporter permease [bacterium]
MKHVIFMAWRYLGFYWGKTVVLVASISLILFLPAGLHVLVEQGADVLTARAEATPLLIGAKGSAVDLVLSALYFRPPHGEPMPHREVGRVDGSSLAHGIPLHLRFAVGRQRILGTTLDYAEFRGLTVDRGRWFAMLGECVLGSEAARALGVDVGDHVLSAAGSAFDVAGSFPLKMPVVGVLAPTGTADDEIVLVDLKTAWVISGLAHGHEDVSAAEEGDARVLRREGVAPQARTNTSNVAPEARPTTNVVASASVLSYTEITPDNLDSFHFHGDPADFPIDAVLAVPESFKASVLLRGRYETGEAPVQMIVPAEVVEELVDTMFSVRDWVLLGSLAVGVATAMTAALVFALSIRVRRREIETIQKIGGGRQRLAAILGAEILFVIVAAIAIAGMLTAVVSRFGEVAVRLVGG